MNDYKPLMWHQWMWSGEEVCAVSSALCELMRAGSKGPAARTHGTMWIPAWTRWNFLASSVLKCTSVCWGMGWNGFTAAPHTTIGSLCISFIEITFSANWSRPLYHQRKDWNTQTFPKVTAPLILTSCFPKTLLDSKLFQTWVTSLGLWPFHPLFLHVVLAQRTEFLPSLFLLDFS